MLEKGQIKIRADLALEGKTQITLDKYTELIIKALIVFAIFTSSSLVFMAAAFTNDNEPIRVALRMIGTFGFAASIFFAFRLYCKIKKQS